MVATRIALIVGFMILFITIGASWLEVGSDQYGAVASLNGSPSLANIVLSYAVGNNPPLNTSAPEFQAYAASVLPEPMTGNPLLVATMVLFPAAVVLALLSFARWQLSLLSGISAAMAGATWISGVPQLAAEASPRLGEWTGPLLGGGGGGNVAIASSLGPYISIAGGIVLVAIYALTRAGKLDEPFE